MTQAPVNTEFTNFLQKAVEDALKNRGNVNVLIAGKTGVGKSTLIVISHRNKASLLRNGPKSVK